MAATANMTRDLTPSALASKFVMTLMTSPFGRAGARRVPRAPPHWRRHVHPSNFVYVLMDDFWLLGGDAAAMPQTKALVADVGVSFANFFVSNRQSAPPCARG